MMAFASAGGLLRWPARLGRRFGGVALGAGVGVAADQRSALADGAGEQVTEHVVWPREHPCAIPHRGLGSEGRGTLPEGLQGDRDICG